MQPWWEAIITSPILHVGQKKVTLTKGVRYVNKNYSYFRLCKHHLQ